jgi:hypothetical protein
MIIVHCYCLECLTTVYGYMKDHEIFCPTCSTQIGTVLIPYSEGGYMCRNAARHPK